MKTMIVAGVMSGTSADGVDVALVRIAPSRVTDGLPRVKLLAHEHFVYTAEIREAVLRAMEVGPASTAELARLNWRLGQVYAECVAQTVTHSGMKPKLIGCHGQTIYHQAVAESYCGTPVRATWQIGEASVVAETMRVPVVGDFRPADLAAGGQGAPLVPLLDLCLFRSQTKNRVLLNLGGIANVSAIPAGADVDGVLAFDTGPANMVIDAVMQRKFGRAFDCGGQTGARGTIVSSLVAESLRDPYFAAPPPKSCGREQFGSGFVDRFLAASKSVKQADAVASATALTAQSILDAYAKFCWPHLGQRAPLARATEMIAAGGGTHNAFLMRLLREGLEPLGVKLLKADDLGMPSEAKEAVAFALLAWMTWHRLPGNVISATGAARPAVLGKVTFV
jgi:anhydro-N-acetylmuramic acid kinase